MTEDDYRHTARDAPTLHLSGHELLACWWRTADCGPSRSARPAPLAKVQWQATVASGFGAGLTHRVKARTRSEARAELKKLLGWKRLPPGLQVTRV